ncbi:MAG: MFS transporter [Anaerolineaceae bacterium]|nr:MFS transporter [Anaerolineaceae bacterium]
MQSSLSRRISHIRDHPALRVFMLVWFSQLVSVFGSGLTSFTLGLWVYQQTGSVTAFSLMALAATLPRILLSPLAGVVADRFDRRLVMAVSDAGAGLSTLVVALLMATGRLEIWHLYVATLWSAAFSSFQWPAYSAATVQLVPKEQLGRVNGLVSIGRGASEVLAPALAGLLIGVIGVVGVILIDVVTFLFAVAVLLMVRFPRPTTDGPEPTGTVQASKPNSLLQDATFGWRYVLSRPGLLWLLVFVAIFNLVWSMVGALATPLVLGFAGAAELGLFITIAGSGMLIGSLVMSAWGGPKPRILGVIGFELLSGLCFILMGMEPALWRLGLGAFGAHFTIAVIEGSNKSIWQSKIPEDIQGRVFAAWQMISLSMAPIALLSAGPLADRVFEPLMRSASTVQNLPVLSTLVGAGPGRGVGLMFVLMGVIKIIVSIAGWMNRHVRDVERSA